MVRWKHRTRTFSTFLWGAPIVDICGLLFETSMAWCKQINQTFVHWKKIWYLKWNFLRHLKFALGSKTVPKCPQARSSLWELSVPGCCQRRCDRRRRSDAAVVRRQVRKTASSKTWTGGRRPTRWPRPFSRLRFRSAHRLLFLSSDISVNYWKFSYKIVNSVLGLMHYQTWTHC